MTGTGAGTKLALLDVDGTLTTVRSIWQYLLESCGRWAGQGEDNLARFLTGEISYETFCDLDARLLAGESYARLCEVAATVPLRSGVTELFGALRAAGYRVALVSTGLRLLTSHLATRFPVDACVANDLARIGDRCTGAALIEIGEYDKGKHARALIDRFGADRVVAIGDSAGDLPMFAEAQVSIAVGPVSTAVLAHVDVHLIDGSLERAREWL